MSKETIDSLFDPNVFEEIRSLSSLLDEVIEKLERIKELEKQIANLPINE